MLCSSPARRSVAVCGGDAVGPEIRAAAARSLLEVPSSFRGRSGSWQGAMRNEPESPSSRSRSRPRARQLGHTVSKSMSVARSSTSSLNADQPRVRAAADPRRGQAQVVEGNARQRGPRVDARRHSRSVGPSIPGRSTVRWRWIPAD
jgi:hypothetical protein